MVFESSLLVIPQTTKSCLRKCLNSNLGESETIYEIFYENHPVKISTHTTKQDINIEERILKNLGKIGLHCKSMPPKTKEALGCFTSSAKNPQTSSKIIGKAKQQQS